MNIYKTAEVARIIGIHPNTVRLYEELGLIPKPERQVNGYRVFTDFHIEQFRLARIAFQIEVLQNGLRKKIVEMVKISATGDFDKALNLTNEYLLQVQQERNNAEEAIEIVKQLLSSKPQKDILSLKRKEASEYLKISTDTLRNWEMNGLLSVKRKENGYRMYRDEDIRRLKIIRSLRCANYSLEAILRMLNELSSNPNINIKEALNTPKKNENIISVCDKLISSLKEAESNAKIVISRLQYMKTKF
ncbi:MerR family transcriptional regulator [Geosporobacter ferrireducens]|uniref:MerR family transcriptional regulator n=1 Tax=Geosporobacter ferrireducens TaxID=1424294 RepID=A0A1D8GLY8_9FIRM|nr:MerR family transcriptional regulator [Geosporobacter ferrireducens]AOT71929.1 MerR family transcriptional regulator [Geosporobacter ferrireducens]MTI55718.1 MerR family transcriptional regulator [Geosporobacter ferrireducens]